MRKREGWREGGERETERKREAARESSNVNFPWTFLGVTIKPLVLLKIESKKHVTGLWRKTGRLKGREGGRGGRNQSSNSRHVHA